MPINDNLETMAKQLYDYWFVQFDFPNEEGKPYKSSGGAMVWNENLKCEIPQGWVVEKMGKCTNVLLGGTPDTNDNSLWGNGYNWLNSGEVAEFPILKSEKNITPKGLEKSATVLAPKGSVTLSITRHLRPSILCIDACINQSVVAILENDKVSKEYIYPLLNRDIPRLMSLRTGAQQPHINKETVEAINVVLPPANIMGAYINIAESIYNAIFNNAKEIAELTKQRDELLPLLMNGQASVNYHLSASFLSSLILYRDQYKFYDMKETIIQTVLDGMRAVLTENQLDLLTDVTRKALSECEITPKATEEEQRNKENVELLGAFISSKKVEGCSDKTIHYYKSSIEKLIATVKKNVCDIATNDIRCYLADQQEQRGLSKVTIDNLRRIYSSFFSWLEDEDYITKSPVRRIHKVRTDALVKEVLTDENIEVLRDSCHELRDIAMIDLLLSTGMRVGELVKINRDDIDFQERQCVVFGKGNKEREVYFNARTKIHLKKYLEQRTDTNPALFVSLHEPHTRLTISGVEVRLRQLGKRVNLNKVHPHKFRRTLATMAIDKGMPIEQVQKMLGHVKIDTTLHYAMVNQTNVKIAHRKFLN
nr:site-specific tyrosine recombinase [Bacteroides fragilis]